MNITTSIVWLLARRLPAPVVLFASLAILCPAIARAGSVIAWQQADSSFDPRTQPMAGLDFLVQPDAKTLWPRITIQMQIDFGRHYCGNSSAAHASLAYSPIDFGVIWPVAAEEQELVDCVRTWSGTDLRIAYVDSEAPAADEELQLRVLASRLHPGLLVEADTGLILFGAARRIGMPRPVEKPDGHPGVSEPRTVSPTPSLGQAGPSAVPRHAAARIGDEVRIVAMEDIGALPPAELTRGWLLVWYGAGTFFKTVRHSALNNSASGIGGDRQAYEKLLVDADCPMLFLFGDGLAAIGLDEEEAGIFAESDAERLRVVVLPLLGEFLPPAADTERWAAGGLPEDIVRRCDWWAGHTAGFPVRVQEDYAWDAGSDTVTITEKFEFEPLRSAGMPAAPVPPILAVAHIEGFKPMSFSAAPDNPGLFTSIGSFLAVPGADSYEIRVSGLDRYIEPHPAPGGEPPARLVEAIRAETAKIVAAGHLAPGYFRGKVGCGWPSACMPPSPVGNLFNTPGEILFFLAEALPFLDPGPRMETLEYMRRERREYPPENRALLPYDEGARRENRPLRDWATANLPVKPQKWEPNIPIAPNQAKMALYWLDAYYRTAGADELKDDWPNIKQLKLPRNECVEWATGMPWQQPGLINWSSYGNAHRRLARKWDNNGGVVDVNHDFADYVALARLAQMAGDSDTGRLARGLLARTACARFAYAVMKDHLYHTGTLIPRPGWETPEEDVRVPLVVDEFGMSLVFKEYMPHSAGDGGYQGRLLPLGDAAPELAMFIRDHARDVTGQCFAAFEYNIPNWHLAWTEATIFFESTIAHPMDGYQTFLWHALMADTPPERLEKLLDLPWYPRGDLYYLGKVVETIRAYQRQ